MSSATKGVKTGDVGASPYPPSGEITIQGEIHPLPKTGEENHHYVVHPRCPVFTSAAQRQPMTHSSRHRKSAKSRRLGSVPSIWSNFFDQDFQGDDVRFVGVSYDGQLNGRDAKMFPDSSGRLAVMIHGAVTMVVDERYLDNPTFGDYLYFEPTDSQFRIKGTENYGIPIIRNCKPNKVLNFDGAPPAPRTQRKTPAPFTTAPKKPVIISDGAPPAPPDSENVSRPEPTPRKRVGMFGGGNIPRSTTPLTPSKETNRIDLDTANILNVLAGARQNSEKDILMFRENEPLMCKLAYHAFLGKKQWMFARIEFNNEDFLKCWSPHRKTVSNLLQMISDHKNDLFYNRGINPFLCLPIDHSRDSVFQEYCILGNPTAPGFPYYIHKLLLADVTRKSDRDNFLISITDNIYFRIHTDSGDLARQTMTDFKSNIPEDLQSTVASWDAEDLEYVSNFGMHGHSTLQAGVHQIAFDLKLGDLEGASDDVFKTKTEAVQRKIKEIYLYMNRTATVDVSMGVGAEELHEVLKIFCRVCKDGPLSGKTAEEEARQWNIKKNSPLADDEVKYTATEFFSEIASYSPEIVMMILKEVLHGNKHFFFDHPLMLDMYKYINYVKPESIDFNPGASDEQISGYYSAFFGTFFVPEFNEFFDYVTKTNEISAGLGAVESYFKPHGIDVASIMSNLNQTGARAGTANAQVTPNRIIGIYLEHTPNENQVRVMLRSHGSLSVR